MFWLEKGVWVVAVSGQLILDLVVVAKGGVRPALGVEAVGAAHQQIGRIRMGQNTNVILALILKKKQNVVIFSRKLKDIKVLVRFIIRDQF